MLDRNDKTGKLEYKVPVDTACMGTTEGCPAAHLRNSDHPLEHLELMRFPGQLAVKRLYKAGYESFFNMMPVLNPGEMGPQALAKLKESKHVVMALAEVLEKEDWVVKELVPDGDFHRHIIGMEAPETGSFFGDFPVSSGNLEDSINGSVYVKKEGKELLVAHWGNGFASPVHGHRPGLEVEVMLDGNLVVNRYRMMDPNSKVVRMTSSQLYSGPGIIEMAYTEAGPDDAFPRQQLIHNFVSYGRSNSLHYVPEHSRDGRDNAFDVEHFTDMFDLNVENTTRIQVTSALKLEPGNVLLVRSASVPALRDHFCVITGGLVVKSNGIRQKDVAIMVKDGHSELLDGYSEFDSHKDAETVILQLNADMAREFIAFHNITMEPKGNEFDDVYDLTLAEVTPISTAEAMHLRRSDVVLVRSTSLPEMGDHYMVVTGHAVQKEHGLRPQTAVFPAMQNSPLLDLFDRPWNKVVLLKLNNAATQAFLNHYGLHLDEALNVVSETHEIQLV